MRYPGLLGLLILLLTISLVASGQCQVSAQGGQNVVNVFVPADRSLRQHLARASKAIEEERFSDAVSELGYLLASPAPARTVGGQEPQDFFLDPAPQSGSRTSLKTEAQRLLGTLPAKGRELYELQFGSAARALLDEAIRDKSLEKLHEVTRRYFHTKAGGEASLLLGRLYLDGGRPLAAALLLKQLADLPALAADFEPELSVLLAACWYQAHQPQKAQQTLQTLEARYPRAKVRIGAMEAEALPRADHVLAWLEQHFGAAQGRGEQRAQWALFRGNESRNAESVGGMPLEGFRWQLPMGGNEHDRRLIEEIQQGYIEQGLPMLAGLQPLAVGNVVLMRTPDQLFGIDFETGKRVWNYPWDMGQAEDTQDQSGISPSSGREERKAKLTRRLWQDAPYGQVSSDGELVFLLDHLPQISPVPARPPWGGMRVRGGLPFPMADAGETHNELVAVELKREGALKWKVGGQLGGEEPQLAGAFFLGPPLPLFGNLYVLAEMRGEVRLVVLDCATGRQHWSQQLAHLEPVWGLDPTLRRLAGATPSFADGVLVCPTSSGAVVGVDVATRRLLWGYQYPQNLFGANSFGMPTYPGGFQAPVGRWLDATATIADGCVLLTPPESELLICLDLLTGQPRWKALSRQRELVDMLYVACVHDGRIVLVGKDRLTAINLSDGQPAWKQPVMLEQANGEMPSGRGFLAGSSYYLPTTSARLVQVDLNEGTIKARTNTEHVLGNLICFKDDVISLGPDRATSSFQLDPLRQRVKDRLTKNAEDAWALARQGELLVHDGKPGEALAVLQRANRLEPRDEGVRSLLVETFLTALRQDFSRHHELSSQIEPLIENESQRIDYLLMLGEGSQRRGDHQMAVSAFGKLARLAFASFTSDIADPFPVVSPSPAWNVRLDRYVYARLAELYRGADGPVREQIDTLVRELGSVSGVANLTESARFLQLCGFHPAANEFRLRRAAQLIDSGKLLEGEWELATLSAAKEPTIEGAIMALRARLYSQTKDLHRVAANYEELRRRWPSVVVFNGKTGQQLYDEAIAKGLVRSEPVAEIWPWGKVVVQELTDAPNRHGFRRISSIPVVQRSEVYVPGMRLMFDTGSSMVYVRDGAGEILVRLSQVDSSYGYQTAASRAETEGHLLFANLAGQLLAVPLLHSRPNDDDAILWKEALLPMPPEANPNIPRHVSRSMQIPFDSQPKAVFNFEDMSNKPVAVTGPMNRIGVCFQKIRTLTCVEPLTGKPVWSRQDVDQGLELFGDDQFVLALPRGEREALVLDAVDGQLLGKRATPPADHRWTTCERYVLAWEEKDSNLRLFLLDVERQQDIWSETLAAGSKGCLVEHNAVAILQPNGRFFLRSLNSDKILIERQLELDHPVESIRVRMSQGQYLLIVNDNQPLPADLQQVGAGNNFALTPVNGRIFAFDRRDGSPLWQSPAVVRGFALPVEQPDELPTLWFVRQYKQGQIGQVQNNRLHVLCLDRRTGGVLLDKGEVPTQLSSLEVTADAKKHEVGLVLPQISFTLRFTDEPRAPEPPAQYAQQQGGLEAALDRFGEIVTSVTGAILQPSKPAEPTKKP